MTEKKHKFDEELEGVTYREYLLRRYRPYVDFIRHLEKVLGKERTTELVAEYNLQRCKTNKLKEFGLKENQISTIEDVKAWFNRNPDDKFVQMTQTKEEVPSAPDSYCFNVYECLWATVLRELDAGDLGLLLECNTDFEYAKAMNPNLRLERSKTLMQGDDCCDFAFRFAEIP